MGGGSVVNLPCTISMHTTVQCSAAVLLLLLAGLLVWFVRETPSHELHAENTVIVCLTQLCHNVHLNLKIQEQPLLKIMGFGKAGFHGA